MICLHRPSGTGWRRRDVGVAREEQADRSPDKGSLAQSHPLWGLIYLQNGHRFSQLTT